MCLRVKIGMLQVRPDMQCKTGYWCMVPGRHLTKGQPVGWFLETGCERSGALLVVAVESCKRVCAHVLVKNCSSQIICKLHTSKRLHTNRRNQASSYHSCFCTVRYTVTCAPDN